MESCSQYLRDLSTVSRERYKEKVASTGLKMIPTLLKIGRKIQTFFQMFNGAAPRDLVVYMTATPSQFTREAIKVRILKLKLIVYRHGNEC